jgi:predicted nucleic acid-binding protein
MILVDTSVWIDFLTGKNTSHRHILHSLIEKEEDVCITEIILTEILQGIKDDKVYETTKSYLLEFPVVKPGGIETYIRAAELYRKCRKEGKTLRKTVDCIIAAIAQENDLTLLHNDSDFEIIEKCTKLKTFKVK